MGFITKQGLENLDKYKYVSGGYSKVDNIMNHWWEFCIKLMPIVRFQMVIKLNSVLVDRAKYDYVDWLDSEHHRHSHLPAL